MSRGHSQRSPKSSTSSQNNQSDTNQNSHTVSQLITLNSPTVLHGSPLLSKISGKAGQERESGLLEVNLSRFPVGLRLASFGCGRLELLRLDCEVSLWKPTGASGGKGNAGTGPGMLSLATRERGS